jgi:YYY domain-containing protein
MYSYEEQLVFVLLWLLLLKLLQFSVWPQLRGLLSDLAYPVAATTALLLFTAGSWYLALVGLPLHLVILPFLLLFAVNLLRREYRFADLLRQWRWEAIFLLFFLFVLEIRFQNPVISFYSEQFMDHAFLASVMRTPVVPPLDPWFAGGFMNVYYYLGYWMVGALALVTRIPSSIAFNLALPTVYGLCALNLYALGHLLLRRVQWLPVTTLLLVNPSVIYHLLLGVPLLQALDQSRHAISATLTEYPLYSIVLGEPHAYVIGMINQVLLLLLLVVALQRWPALSSRHRLLLASLTALSLGTMPPMNAWDALVYGPLVIGTGLLLWWRYRRADADKHARFPSWAYLLLVPISSLALYLPYYLALSPGAVQGIGIVTSPSDPGQFLLVYGFFFLVIGLYCLKSFLKRPYLLLLVLPCLLLGYSAAAIPVVLLALILSGHRRRPEDLGLIIGLLLVTFCEVLYLREIYTDEHFRMNTVYKFSYIAWFLFGISCTTIVGRFIAGHLPEGRPGPALLPWGMALVMVALLLAAPLLLPLDIGGEVLGIRFPGGYHTLDGLAYLEVAHPGDAGVVRFLADAPRGTRIVEAIGGDYSYSAPISSFTGIPTVLAKRSHEYQWRTNQGNWWGERSSDLQKIYEDPDKTIPLMKKYGCTYLFLGSVETEVYHVNIPYRSLDLVYDQDGAKLYRIRG